MCDDKEVISLKKLQLKAVSIQRPPFCMPFIPTFFPKKLGSYEGKTYLCKRKAALGELKHFTMDSLIQYNDAVNAIKTAILQGQYEAAKGVNRIQLALYYAIGKYLSQHTRKGVWGEGALAAISEQLRKDLPGLRGFSETQMKDMRRFYEAWKMLDNNMTVATAEITSCNSAVTTAELQDKEYQIDIFHTLTITNIPEFPVDDFFKVPFTHHSAIIIGTKDTSARYYYIHRTAEEHLAVKKLRQLIKEDAFHSQGHIPNNFTKTINDSKEARRAIEMFKDEYLLDFINVEEIGVREKIDVDERVVEQSIVQNIKNFIMTFGRDFAFIGNQYHLEIYGVEQFPDLLFFNRELNAMVCIELKLGEFKTSYLGQLFGYLQILDDKVRKPHENPSIGIVLCQSANYSYAEYAVRDYTKPMGVATYKTLDDMPERLRKALPDMKKMIDLLKIKEE